MANKSFVTIALDSEADKDLIRWLGQQDNRSAAVRAAIRAQIQGNGVTLGDVYQAVRDLERKLKGGPVVIEGDQGEAYDEPPDVAAALDALGSL